MTVRLTLVCHAATMAMRTSAFPSDEALDPRGSTRLPAVAAMLGRFDHCWTSPALRARQTAEGLGLPVTLEPALRDCDYGRWTGRTLGEVQAAEPEAVAAWMGDPAAAPHGGESLLDLIRRVGTWLDGLGPDGRIVAVTHASVLRATIVQALGASAASFWRIDAAPLSTARLSRHGDRWTLGSVGPTGKDGATPV